MNDAISTIALGVDTAPGLQHLKELRQAFAGLRGEIVEFNALKSNPQAVTGGTSKAQNELTTLGVELRNARNEITKHQDAISAASRSTVATTQSTAKAVVAAVQNQNRGIIESESSAAAATQRLARETTRVIQEETTKRYSMGQSAKVGGVSYSMKGTSNESEVNSALAQAEKTRREIQNNARSMLMADIDRHESARLEKAKTAQSMLTAEIDRAEATRLERGRVSQTMLMAEVDRSEGLQRQKRVTANAMTMAEIDRAEAMQRERRAVSQSMTMAETDRAEARKRERVAVSNAMQMAEIDRAEARKLEKNQTAQNMMIAQIDRDEARKIEVVRNARAMQMAEIDRTDTQRRQKAQTAREMLIADIEREEARKREIRQNANIIQMAEIDRQDDVRRQKQKTANEMLIADAMRAEERRNAILNNNFSTASLGSQVRTVGRAKGLVDNGESRLANELYGKEAVAAVANYDRMLSQLNATQQRGGASARDAAQNHRVVTGAMNDAHSAARGLAGGIGQLWVTWGNTVPLVAGAVIAGSLAKSLTMGKEVEFQLQFLRALANDFEREPIDFEKFLGITEGSMSSLKEASEGMRALAQNGLDQRKALAALPDVLNLSVIGEMDVGSAALSATGIAQAFKMQANEIGKVGDIFSQVAASSNTSVRGMTESMKQASTAGDMFKVTIEETASAIGVLAQRNIIGTAAGTALTNSLKSLYEPTVEAKKAMDSVGLSTSDGKGNIKGYTELIDDLRQKLSQMNEASRAVFLGTIADQRGSKALSAVTSDYDTYLKFLSDAKESSGFMSAAVLQLEDTVHGSFRRMTNAVDDTFNRAFKEAEPTVRQVAGEIGKLAKSDEVVQSLANLAIATARVTQTLIENGGTILKAVGAYAALRVVSGVSSAFVVWRNSVAAATLAAAANAAATTGAAGAIGGAGIVAGGASVGMTRFAMSVRMASAAFGPLSLLLMAGYTAYELLGASTSRAENELMRANNTTDTAIGFYDRQIEKLKALNDELRTNAELTKKAGIETSRATLQKEVDQAQVEVNTQEVTYQPNAWGDWDANNRIAKRDLELARKRLEVAQGKLNELDTKKAESDTLTAENQKLTKRQTVARRLDDLDKMAGGKSDTFGDQGNDKTKVFIKELDDLKAELAKADADADDIAKRAGEVGKKINAALNNFVKPENDKSGKAAARDAYGAGQLKLDGELQRIKDLEKSALATNKTNLAVNEIGSLQSIANELAIVTKARQDELVVFEQKEAMAAAAEGRKRNQQSIENKKDGVARELLEADRDAVRQRRELFAKWDEESMATEARNLRDRGQMIKAFEQEFNSKNGGEMKQIDNDLADPRTNYAQKEALGGRKEYLTNEWNSGRQSAQFAELEAQYEALVSNMEERLAEVATKASATNGFLSDVGAAAMADGIRSETIPAVDDLLAKMGAIADGLGDPKLKGNVSKMGTDMVREAQRSTKAWMDAGKSIEKSLGDAFGKGGKAVGGVISAMMRQKAEQKELDDQVKKAQSDPKMDKTKLLEVQNAATLRSTEIQLASYGSIAGAAKGYFDEQTKGYAIMQAAEQTFRAFEIASALNTHLTKSGFLASFLGLFSTVKATEVAVEAGTVAPTIAAEGAKAGAHGVTALAAALSLPFPANLPAFAVTAAMLAAIGVAVSGAGGGGSKVNLSEERQKFNGTGKSYNADDTKKNAYDWELEKSQSLDKALSALRNNSEIELRYSSSQLLALESINAGISGLVNTVSMTTGIRGTRADEASLGVFDKHSKLGFSSSSKTLLDSGIAFSNANIGSIMGGNAVAQSYAEMETKKKSFWGLSSSKKTGTEYQNLDKALAEQMSLIVGDMYSVVKDAATSFGKDNASVEAMLQSMTLSSAGLSKISLKGLSSDEVEKELQAAFGSLGDSMAKVALPGLNAFQQAGEGYMSTIVRVSSGIESAQYTMQKLGIAAADYSTVLNKQGNVSMEIVRASLMQKEATDNVATGIGQMVKTFNGSAAELAESYTKLNDVRRTMKATGDKDGNVTADMVKGAGGVDNLASGMASFLEEFFTEAERSVVQASLLGEEFQKLNVTMPASEKQFRDMVQGIDRSTAAGQTLYGSLINLSGQFAELTGEIGLADPAVLKQRAGVLKLAEATEKWLDTITNARSLLADINSSIGGVVPTNQSGRIEELRKLLSSDTADFDQQLTLAGELKDLVLEKYEIEKENANDLIKFGQELRQYVLSLKVGELSPLTKREKLQEAQAQYNQTLSDVKSSDKDVSERARGELQTKASTLLEMARGYYASSSAYTSIFGTVSEQLSSLGVESGKGEATLEQTNKEQLTTLQDLKELVTGVLGKSTENYNASKGNLEQQLTVLQGMYERLGVLSDVPTILRDLPAELAAAMSDKVDGTGLDGSKLAINGSHASGLDYVPFDGYVAELHRGERVLTESEARRTDKAAMATASTASFTSTEKAEMAAEIRELRAAVEALATNQDNNNVRLIQAVLQSGSATADKIVGASKAGDNVIEKPKVV